MSCDLPQFTDSKAGLREDLNLGLLILMPRVLPLYHAIPPPCQALEFWGSQLWPRPRLLRPPLSLPLGSWVASRVWVIVLQAESGTESTVFQETTTQPAQESIGKDCLGGGAVSSWKWASEDFRQVFLSGGAPLYLLYSFSLVACQCLHLAASRA